MFFRFLVLIHACTAFPLQCPEPAQWSIRARGLCPDPSKYSCLKNDLINGYSENCTISDFQAPGRKGVLRGGLDADICSQERYHPWPIKYYTNVSTNCIFVKSVCNEEGQVVYATGNRNTDITCRCDYTRGYDFIRKPRNPCYCVPSEEDCSCYLKSCIDKIYFLSADYKCIHEKMNTSTANCQTIIRESVSTERSDSSTEDTTITENIPTIVQRESYTRIIVITFCIGIILVYCIHELRGNRYCKATKPTKDSRTLIDHNTNAYDVENKAVEGFGDDKKDLALTSCFDKEIQQSQMEELEKDNDRLTIEVKRLKADRRNVPDLMMETLKQWKKEDEYFIKTRASTHVMDCIKNHPCVSVIGPSGVGKTFLVQHIALEMNKIGYTIMKVSKPEEIETNYISDRKTLFVVDDMCGNFTARKKLLHDWIMKMDNINVLLKTDFCKLILTCRLQVFRDEGFEHANLTVFQNCICNLNDNQLSLTIFEKQELAQKYFKDAYNVNMISILDLCQYDFFPFLCHYYDKNKSKANFCLKSFVRDPFALFERNISTLFVEGQGSRYKFCALLLLVLCNNQIKTKHLVGEDDKYKIILKDIQEKCRIDKQLTGEKLISELHKLTGTFLKNHKGVYQTIHDKLFDFLTHYFGTENKVTKTEFIELLIRHANYKLIEERFVIKKPDQSDDKKSKEYIITIEKREDNDQLQLYTERVFDDMTKADRYLWSNRNLYYEPFKTTFITFIKELKKVNILDFIKNASSLFVRDMFAMDVNDLNTIITCQCGILLDHEHLQEFVERIFRDMKKSDDIRDYIDNCRCCRNEIFRTALRTYMLQLSRDKIQDLISSASSCFLQIMFVMKERDIEHSVYSSKSFRESYGIEIPKDDIHMYLERVCHEMKKCTDVPTYISNLRCCRDQDFTTALNRFMNDPPFVRIEELKKVSISFIQRMCVLTEEDINHKSPHVFQRYGFKISCDKRKEYIERVFNDIRKSINVNEHIELNRNRENLVFQTKLKSYMSQLGREQIKNLIEFASQDFIDRLCVMTIDSITDTFDFKYERYGVVIPEDCSNLYISRVFHGLKKSDDTESYVKNNRNLQTKKFKTSLRHYIKTLPDNEIKNLFQTASSDFLHKWFVTSKQDIQIDSKRSYEQYGIILHGKNLQIYNERILTLIKSDTSFRYDITCNRNITSVFEYVSQLSVSELTEVIKTASIEFFHKKIIVDVQNELEKKLSDCQSFDYVGDNILKVKEGFIRCPGSNIKQYMDRMVADWKTGNLYAVIENVNMKNQSFKQKFMDHLNRLEPFEMTKLINGTEQKTTICYSWKSYGKVNCLAIAITVCCIYCDSNLAKWCVQSHCSGNQNEKHYKMCALFMLVVFNNELTEMTLLDKAPKVMDVISSFGRNHDIHFGHDDISAELLREVLDTSMNGIVTQHNGVYSVINNLVFDYLCMYFGSLQHLSNIFVKYGDVKVLYETFMVNKMGRTDWGLQYRSDTELQICIERVFESMSESNENIRYILDITDITDKIFFPIIDINNHRIVKEISNYNRNLTKDKIEMLIKNACIDFLNNFILIPKAETQDDIYVIVRPVIEIPDTFVNMYIKRIFDNMIKSECVETCLKENINLKNKAFHATLSALFNAINKEEVENLIREASSDFMSQMLVISKECIKDESFWECERYGIVVPETFLPKYIERVFNDMTNPINVPKNRNNMNNKFRDSFHSHIRSISADKLTSLIKTASSKFISHMCLSTEGEIHNIIAQRTACYFMFVPNKFLNIFRQHMFENKCSTSNYTSIFMEDVLSFLDNSHTITLQYYGSTESGTFLLLVSFQNDEIFDNLHPYPSKQLFYDFFTCKTIQFCVKSSKSIVEHYIQRMIKDWQDGKVHDVFGNINLSNTSFQCTFITYLMNIGAADQTVLAKTKDIVTGDSPLAVCCYVGILKLAKWCMEHNSNTNSVNNFHESPLYIACRHAHPVIVSCLLNHENKADVNKRSGLASETPLYEACKRGFKTIVLLLLKEDVDVNYLCNNKTPLYVACNYGHIEIVRILLAQNNIIDINKGYKAHGFDTPLYIACKVGHKEIVSLLLNHTADGVDVSKHTDEGETPLYAACQGGYTDIVKLLLAHEIRVINKSKIDGASPLFIACQEGHVEVVSSLLKHTIIEIDQCMLIGMSPLFIASLLGHTEIVKMLLERKANAYICVNKKEMVTQVFIKKFERVYRKPKTLDYTKYIKFLRKLVSNNATEHVKSYIEGKENDWVFNSILGASPLHMGSLMGHIEIVKLLVERNSNINSFSEKGSTPLILAYELGHTDIVQVLLANGADPP